MESVPRSFTINFVGGVAAPQVLPYGTYTCSLTDIIYPTGYGGGSFNPTEFTVEPTGEATRPLKLAAQGTLVVHIVNQDTGQGVTGASFLRYLDPPPHSSPGYTAEPGVIVDNGNGTYTLNYLPYDPAAPLPVYLQIQHREYAGTELTARMGEQRVEVKEPVELVQTGITLNAVMEDAYYTVNGKGIPLSGEISGTPIVS